MQKLTNSARNKFAACHRAYQLFYVQGKRPVIPSDALGFGTAMHALLEGVWGGSSSRANGKGDGELRFNTGDPYRDMTLKALYEGYLDRYRIARLGVESTRRDLEYCMQIELHELNMKF